MPRSLILHIVLVLAAVLAATFNANVASAAELVRWIAQGDGLWDAAANWSGGVVPGAADDVVIDVPRNTKVTHRAGDDRVRSLVSRNPLVFEGGTLSLDTASSTTNTFTLVGGFRHGPGDLKIDGLFTWTGGCMFVGRTIARAGPGRHR